MTPFLVHDADLAVLTKYRCFAGNRDEEVIDLKLNLYICIQLYVQLV